VSVSVLSDRINTVIRDRVPCPWRKVFNGHGQRSRL